MRLNSIWRWLALAIVAVLAWLRREPPALAMRADAGGHMSEARGQSVLQINQRADDGATEVMIYGPIGDYYWDGVTAHDFALQLAQIKAERIRVRMTTPGGSVDEGVAIHNALKDHPAHVTVVVDSVAASIGALIAMAGDVIELYPSSRMMLHKTHASASGNDADFDAHAATLRTATRATAEAFAARSGKTVDEILALIADGQDHWFTAAEAVEFGLADRVIDGGQDSPTNQKLITANLLTHLGAISRAPSRIAAQLRQCISAAATPQVFAQLGEAVQRAVLAQTEDPNMKQRFLQIMAGPNDPPAPPKPTNAPAPPADPPAPADPAALRAAALAELTERNTSLRNIFAGFRDRSGIADLESSCLADPAITVEQAQGKLLAKLGSGAAPVGGSQFQAGADEVDKRRSAGVQILLARANALTPTEAAAARQGNPFGRGSLLGMAEQCLIQAGINTRDMDREQIATRVLAHGQGVDDFPVILENTLHKLVVAGYNAMPFTWRLFCGVGTLSDLRPHNRYHMSSFSDLAEVNEHGEYVNGQLGDGAKETITGKRKGRILSVSVDLIINDDLGVLSNAATMLGQAAGRTIEKDVYALLALNSGLGPNMSDGNPMFHASHSNIAGTAAAPTVASFDAAAVLMASQLDVGGNDYLDIRPYSWLGPLGIAGSAKVVNGSEYDPDSNNKLQRPNISRDLVTNVIGTPRLAGTRWYMFADPNIAPAFEVAFLDGVQVPQIAAEDNFRTEGRSWRVTHKYGAAGVDSRSAVTNAGA